MNRYPIAVEATTVYVLWVEGDTADEALADAKNDVDLHEEIRRADPIDGWLDCRAADPSEFVNYESTHGPEELCVACGKRAYRANLYYHEKTCPRHPSQVAS